MAVRVGILGAGSIGRVHAEILREDRRVQLVGVADIDVARARSLAEATGARAIGSLDELLDLGVDAVYVTTPNTQHTEPVIRVVEAGAHVFCEKPMATSTEDARRIVDAVRRHDRLYQLGMNRRFAPVYRRVKELLEGGQIRPTLAHIKMNRGELQKPPWVSDPVVTGGYLWETPFHLLDLARYFFGDVTETRVMAARHYYRELDDFALLLRFASGCIATFASSAHASWHFPFERVEIFGDHTTIETQEMERVSYTPGLNRATETWDFFQLDMKQKWGYVEEDRLFVDAVERGGPTAVTAEDGLRTVELVDAVYKATDRREGMSAQGVSG